MIPAFNFTTMQAYSGANAALVSNGFDDLPAFATFNQLKAIGHSVNKGAKGIKIFCGYRTKKDSTDKIPVWGTVFDIIDTTAAKDVDFLQWLRDEIKGGKVKQPVTE